MIPGFVCLGGAFTLFNGTVDTSICGEKFGAENFLRKHTGPGIVSTAKAGPNTNGSQSLLCTAEHEWSEGKHMVLHKVEKGMNIGAATEGLGSNGHMVRRSPLRTMDNSNKFDMFCLNH